MEKKERRFPRAASINTVLVTAIDGEPLDHFLKTHSLSLGGCGFSSQVALGVDATLNLMIALRTVAFKVTARVVYCYQSEGGLFEIGCEFLDLANSERQLIEELVASCLAESARDRSPADSAGGTAAPD